MRAKFLVRSSSESRKQMVADMVCSAFELIGAEVELSALTLVGSPMLSLTCWM